MVNESFFPAIQQTRVLYCRLSGFLSSVFHFSDPTFDFCPRTDMKKTNPYHYKSINLHIIRWSAVAMGQMTHPPNICYSKYCFFFHKILQNSLQNPFNLYLYFSIKLINENNECPKSIRNYRNMMLGRRVVCSIGPANQCIIL